MTDNKPLNRQHISTEKAKLSQWGEREWWWTGCYFSHEGLSDTVTFEQRPKRSGGDKSWGFPGEKHSRQRKQQVQRCWGRSVLGRLEEQLGAQCDWRGVNVADSSRRLKDFERKSDGSPQAFPALALTTYCPHLNQQLGTTLEVQWLRLQASNAGGAGSIPGQGTKTHMPWGMAKKIKNKNKQQLVGWVRGQTG